jgi:TIR domain-containing protein
MRFDDRVQAYADKLLSQSQNKIDADHKKKIEAVFLGQTSSLIPNVMYNLVEAYMGRIRRLGQARMESLIMAHEHAEIPLDTDVIQEIKSQVISLCHSEQDDIYNRIPRLTSPDAKKLVIDASTSEQIVREVGEIMREFSLELDIKTDKISLAEEIRKKTYGAATGKRWDAFISHASEDKDSFVRPLAEALQKSGLEIWFDETTLKVGDRLREAIDYGLSKSRYGIVVLSKHFFLKDWTKEELEGLTAKEIGGVKVILPVWHNVARDEVAKHSPTLAGRLAARSQDGLEKVVRQLREAMGKESPKPLESVKKNGLTLDQEVVPPDWALSPDQSELTPYELEAVRRKLSITRLNALHPRLTIWITNRSDVRVLVKSASLWHGHKRLNYGVPSDNRSFVEVRPHTENTAIAFVTDEDAMLKLQSLGIVDRHLPTFTFSEDVDLEVRAEYDLQGLEYEYRETVRVRVHGNRQVDSL